VVLSLIKENNLFIQDVKAQFDGKEVRLGKDARGLYEQSGYGRPEKDGSVLRLAPVEALYLIHRNRIEIPGYDFDRLLSAFTTEPNFLRSYLVYRDLRERGYAVQTGPHDFRVFRRGERPGTGQSKYMVRVLSERDIIDFGVLVREFSASAHMRKQHVLAVVDDENELTYYEIKVQSLQEIGPSVTPGPLNGTLFGRSAVLSGTDNMDCTSPPDEIQAGKQTGTLPVPGQQGPQTMKAPVPPCLSTDSPAAGSPGTLAGSFGMRLDRTRLVLSSLETLYLMQTGSLVLLRDGKPVGRDEYLELATIADLEMGEKVLVYSDLREHGYIPKTGYKFGHHFRVYTGTKVHSEMLVHAVATAGAMPMSTISRSVRLSHSVKKKMLFGCVHTTGIHYIEFARIKL
jgi:tRNA-intron endonuclease, archaea type